MAKTDHRVQFDFDLTFSNGGALTGKEFRLDIDGETISDDELADRLITELGLLMVDDVQIHSKRIVSESHKRAREARSEEEGTKVHLLDLSHTVEEGMITYPGLPGPVIEDLLSREESRSRYSEGTEFLISMITLCSNTGTYVDSPYHRYADGGDVASLPLDRLADLSSVTVNVSGNQGRAIDRSHFLPYDIAGKAVLVHTGWDRHWRTEAYFSGHPYVSEDAAAYLVEQGVLLVGIDSLNIDDIAGGERPAHSLLLGAGIPVCEHMTHLDALPVEGYRFSAVPAPIRGMGTFPVRAFAIID